MGLNNKYLNFINESSSKAIGNIKGKCMLELGNQIIRNTEYIKEKTGKEYYTNRGVFHISIDLNGQNGALMLDLSKPLRKREWINYFDIITNSGTTEHVEPRKAQYDVFKNIHECMKVGGISIHLIPDILELEMKGKWKSHCKNYYSKEFFLFLAKYNNYEIIELKIINGLVCSTLRKTIDSSFMDDKELFLSFITRKNTGVIYKGINTGTFNKLIRNMRIKLKTTIMK